MSFMYRENNKGPRTVPWGSDKTGAQSDLTPFTTTRCYLKQRKESINFNVLPQIPLLNTLLLKSSWGRIKCLFKIKYECVNLSAIVQDFSPIIYYRSKLSLQLCHFLNTCCLSDRSLYSSRRPMRVEHTMCSSNLQGSQLKETGR